MTFKKINRIAREKKKNSEETIAERKHKALENISVVLIEPRFSGNVGAISRAMKNFALTKLILVNPECEIDDELLKRAKHSKDVVKAVRVVSDFFSLSKEFDYIIGTTAILGKDKHILRVPITPKKLMENIDLDKKIAIVLGREGDGMSNEEIEICNILLSIPTDKNYATLNISTAASIIFYELYQAFGAEKITKHINSIEKTDMAELNKLLNNTIETLDFRTIQKKNTQRITWQKIFGKSFLTKKEFLVVMGFFKKILKK